MNGIRVRGKESVKSPRRSTGGKRLEQRTVRKRKRERERTRGKYLCWCE